MNKLSQNLENQIEKKWSKTHKLTWEILVIKWVILPSQRDEIIEMKKEIEYEDIHFVELCIKKWRLNKEQADNLVKEIEVAQIWNFLVKKWLINNKEKENILDIQSEEKEKNKDYNKPFCVVWLENWIIKDENKLIEAFAEFSWVEIFKNLDGWITNIKNSNSEEGSINEEKTSINWVFNSFNSKEKNNKKESYNPRDWLLKNDLINKINIKWISNKQNYWKGKKAFPIFLNKWSNWNNKKDLTIITSSLDTKKYFIEEIEKDTGYNVYYHLCSQDLINKALEHPNSTTPIFNATEYVNNIALISYLRWASDIHYEKIKNKLRIRIRILWDLETLDIFEWSEHDIKTIINKLYINTINSPYMPDLSLTWAYQINIAWFNFDLRVNWMEINKNGDFSAVLRITKKANSTKNINSYNLSPNNLDNLIKASKEDKLIIATGPTWSWKSTMLFAIISELDTENIKIYTIQDPIEHFHWEYLIHCEVKPQDKKNEQNNNSKNKANGLSFEEYIKELLRQDPDKFLIWEVRDKKVAKLVVSAVNTGHGTFTSMHTNDWVSVLYKLCHEYWINLSSLDWTVITNQRLVKKLCSCAEEVTEISTEKELKNAKLKWRNISWAISEESLREHNFYKKTITELWIGYLWYNLKKAKWCPHCKDWYSSQQVVLESFIVDEKIIQMVKSWAEKKTVQNYISKTQKNNTLYEDGLRLLMLWVIDYIQFKKLENNFWVEIKDLDEIINNSYSNKNLNNINILTEKYNKKLIWLLNIIWFESKTAENIKWKIIESLELHEFKKAWKLFSKLTYNKADPYLIWAMEEAKWLVYNILREENLIEIHHKKTTITTTNKSHFNKDKLLEDSNKLVWNEPIDLKIKDFWDNFSYIDFWDNFSNKVKNDIIIKLCNKDYEKAKNLFDKINLQYKNPVLNNFLKEAKKSFDEIIKLFETQKNN